MFFFFFYNKKKQSLILNFTGELWMAGGWPHATWAPAGEWKELAWKSLSGLSKLAFKAHSTAVKCWRKVPAFRKWQAGVRTSKTDSLFKAVIPSSTTEAQAWHSAQHTRRRATIYSTFTKWWAGCCAVHTLSRVWLCAIPWTVARQAPLSLEFSRQEYWSGLPFPSPGDLPHGGTERASPTLAGRFFTNKPPGKPLNGNVLNMPHSILMLTLQERGHRCPLIPEEENEAQTFSDACIQNQVAQWWRSACQCRRIKGGGCKTQNSGLRSKEEKPRDPINQPSRCNTQEGILSVAQTGNSDLLGGRAPRTAKWASFS